MHFFTKRYFLGLTKICALTKWNSILLCALLCALQLTKPDGINRLHFFLPYDISLAQLKYVPLLSVKVI